MPESRSCLASRYLPFLLLLILAMAGCGAGAPEDTGDLNELQLSGATPASGLSLVTSELEPPGSVPESIAIPTQSTVPTTTTMTNESIVASTTPSSIRTASADKGSQLVAGGSGLYSVLTPNLGAASPEPDEIVESTSLTTTTIGVSPAGSMSEESENPTTQEIPILGNEQFVVSEQSSTIVEKSEAGAWTEAVVFAEATETVDENALESVSVNTLEPVTATTQEPANVKEPTIEPDILPELLSPINGQSVESGVPIVLIWKIPMLALVTVGAFEVQLIDNSESELVFRDTTVSPAVCDTEGRCTYSLSQLPNITKSTEIEWRVREASGNADEYVQGTFRYEVTETAAVEVELVEVTTDESSSNETVEPTNYLNHFYVDNAGQDSDNGRSVDRAFKTIQKAVDQAGPGDIVHIRAGDYSDQTVLIDQSGSVENPITIAGYQSSPGDDPSYNLFDHTSEMYASVMPLLDTGSRTGDHIAINVTGDHIVLKNIQIRNYRIGVYVENSENTVVDNVIVENIGDPNYSADHSLYNGAGIKFTASTTDGVLRNSVVVNSTGEAISISGHNHIVEGNSVYANDNSTGKGSATDYYFILSNAFDCIIRENRLERVGNLGHVGHGFTVKHENERNIFEDNLAINLDGGGFVARRYNAANNVFRNNRIEGGNGILVNTGAHNNIFTGFVINNVDYGIWFFGLDHAKINPGGYAAVDNQFSDIEINGSSQAAIAFLKSSDSSADSIGNTFQDIRVNNAPVLFNVGHNLSNNSFSGGTVSNVASYTSGDKAGVVGQSGLDVQGVVFFNNGF